MGENDKNQKQERNEDYFSGFMFGRNGRREESKEGGTLSSRESLSNDRGLPSMDDWFLGNSRRNEDVAKEQTTYNRIENILNNVDIELLMETIDMFVLTTKQLKPLFKEITPFLHQFRKKLKSD